MVVKNGDECHGRIRKKITLSRGCNFPQGFRGANMIKHPPEMKKNIPGNDGLEKVTQNRAICWYVKFL